MEGNNVASLLQLLIAHKVNHENNSALDDMERCKTILLKLNKVLPKLMRNYAKKMTTSVLCSICKVLLLLLGGSVCPHSLAFFRHGDCNTIASMLFYMLPFLMRENLKSVHEQVLQVVAALLTLLRMSDAETSFVFFNDLTLLVEDMALLLLAGQVGEISAFRRFANQAGGKEALKMDIQTRLVIENSLGYFIDVGNQFATMVLSFIADSYRFREYQYVLQVLLRKSNVLQIQQAAARFFECTIMWVDQHVWHQVIPYLLEETWITSKKDGWDQVAAAKMMVHIPSWLKNRPEVAPLVLQVGKTSAKNALLAISMLHPYLASLIVKDCYIQLYDYVLLDSELHAIFVNKASKSEQPVRYSFNDDSVKRRKLEQVKRKRIKLDVQKTNGILTLTNEVFHMTLEGLDTIGVEMAVVLKIFHKAKFTVAIVNCGKDHIIPKFAEMEIPDILTSHVLDIFTILLESSSEDEIYKVFQPIFERFCNLLVSEHKTVLQDGEQNKLQNSDHSLNIYTKAIKFLSLYCKAMEVVHPVNENSPVFTYLAFPLRQPGYQITTDISIRSMPVVDKLYMNPEVSGILVNHIKSLFACTQARAQHDLAAKCLYQIVENSVDIDEVLYQVFPFAVECFFRENFSPNANIFVSKILFLAIRIGNKQFVLNQSNSLRLLSNFVSLDDENVRNLWCQNADLFCIPQKHDFTLLQILDSQNEGEDGLSNYLYNLENAELSPSILAMIAVGVKASLENKLFLWSLFRLMQLWRRNKNSDACIAMNHVLDSKNTTWRRLCIQYPAAVYPELIRLLFSSASEKESVDFIGILFDKSVSLEEFLDASAPHVLPSYVLSQNTNVIKRFAINNSSVQSVLFRYIEHIVKEMVMSQVDQTLGCTEDIEVIKKRNNDIWNFLLGFMPKNSSVRDIVQSSPHRLLNVLAWELAGDREKVAKRAFLETSLQLQEASLPVKYFLAMLTDLGRRITAFNKPQSYRLRAVRCVHELLKIFGEVDAYVPKIMATLNASLGQTELVHAACSAYYTFVHMLSDRVLEANLSSIVVSLLPCVTDEPIGVKIFTYLFVEKKAELQNSFCKVAFVPKLPVLEKISDTIEQVIGGANLDILQELEQVPKILRHWNSAVRKMSLNYLLNILVSRAQDLQTLLSSQHMVHQIISTIMQALLHLVCSESNPELQVLAVQCLGAIGAVDPSRLPLESFYDSSHGYKKSKGELSIKELTLTLIEDHLVNGLRAAPENTDSVAFTIQELLQFLATLSADSSSSMWIKQQFEESYEIVAPYWSTSYTVSSRGTTTEPSISDTFYHGSESYEGWIIAWVKHLISLSSYGEKKIFHACRTALSTCPNIARVLLPYLIQNVLRSGKSEDYENIKREIMTVLKDQDIMGLQGTAQHHHQCAQAIFSTLDELGGWINAKESSTASKRNASGDFDHEKENLEEFVKDIPSRVLAETAFAVRAYARALQYFEIYLRQQGASAVPKPLSKGLHVLNLSPKDASFLQRIYSFTDEADGLLGLAVQRRLYEASTTTYGASSLCLYERIIDYEQLAQWEEALLCYEQILQQLPPENVGSSTKDSSGYGWEEDRSYLYAGMIRCMIMLGRVQGALQHADGIQSQNPDMLSTIYPYALECSWRLSRWDAMNEIVTKNATICNHDPDVSLSCAILALQQRKFDSFAEKIKSGRLEIIGPLAAAGVESYQRAYPLLQKLHVLHDLEQGAKVVQAVERGSSGSSMNCSSVWAQQCPWEGRDCIIAPLLKFREPIFAVRRMVLQELGLSEKIAGNWLQCAKMARQSGHWQTAATAAMHARMLRAPNAIIEDAKILYGQGNLLGAMQLLEPIPVDVAKVRATGNTESDTLRAKSLLLATNWIQESKQQQGQKVIERYKAVVRLDKKWEKGYFFLAKYFEELLKKARPSDGSAPDSLISANKYLIQVLENYVRALQHGTKYLFQALPRFLTLWFEFGELLHQPPKKVKKHLKGIIAATPDDALATCLEDIKNIVDVAFRTLPPYEWMACLPQVLSRICHPNPQVVQGVKQIAVRVMTTYPRQGMWTVLGLSRSLNSQRRSRAQEILSVAQRELTDMSCASDASAISESIRLFDELIALSGQDPKGLKKIPVKLSRVRQKLLLPVKDALMAVFPSKNLKDHNAFPLNAVYIKTFGDRADVLMSKEKPKRIKILGSDGIMYPFLCKREQHGDLRKDARMMDINAMVNKVLQRSAEGKKRKLRLRTYAVICLNEESGLMEWVPHTSAMRQLISQIYKTESGFLQPVRLTREIKQTYLEMQDKYKSDLPGMAATYRSKILSLPVFTPRFHQWFFNNFTDPTSWFEARLCFTRSAAVWSMVGHIVGLGDRHGENILIDSTNGECVHVDFDCLFDKGLKLKVPEIVPFRLTPNMIDAFGLTGYEGVYRRVSQVTMELMRNHKETLVTVLESFIHDPVRFLYDPLLVDILL